MWSLSTSPRVSTSVETLIREVDLRNSKNGWHTQAGKLGWKGRPNSVNFPTHDADFIGKPLEGPVSCGPRLRMIQHLTAIWKFRHFLFALVRLDLRLRYRRSVLGIGWSLLNPIAMTVVFAVVFGSLLGGNDIPRYVPHLLLGTAVWTFLRESTIGGCKSLIANESYIRQSPLPYGIYPLRTVFGQAIHSAIALAVAIGVTFAYRPDTNLLALAYIVPGLILSFVTAWAAATIFAFVNVYFQDTSHLLEVGAQILFFMSPIIYYSQNLTDKGLWWMLNLNPVHLFLELIRAPLVTGEPPTGELLLIGTAFTAIVVGLAAGTTAWLQKRVVFHL